MLQKKKKLTNCQLCDENRLWALRDTWKHQSSRLADGLESSCWMTSGTKTHHILLALRRSSSFNMSAIISKPQLLTHTQTGTSQMYQRAFASISFCSPPPASYYILWHHITWRWFPTDATSLMKKLISQLWRSQVDIYTHTYNTMHIISDSLSCLQTLRLPENVEPNFLFLCGTSSVLRGPLTV